MAGAGPTGSPGGGELGKDWFTTNRQFNDIGTSVPCRGFAQSGSNPGHPAVSFDVEEVPTRVFSAEHLACIALETGRPKDKARLLQFIEAGILDEPVLRAMMIRHNLEEKWRRFEDQFLRGES